LAKGGTLSRSGMTGTKHPPSGKKRRGGGEGVCEEFTEGCHAFASGSRRKERRRGGTCYKKGKKKEWKRRGFYSQGVLQLYMRKKERETFFKFEEKGKKRKVNYLHVL